MFTKLMRYEFKMTRHVMVPVFIGFILFSGFFMGLSRLTSQLFSEILAAFYIITVLGLLNFIFIYLLFRIGKGIYGKEGYFMNGLPASAGQNLWVKMIVNFCWLIVYLVAVILVSHFYMLLNLGEKYVRSRRIFFDGISHMIDKYFGVSDGVFFTLAVIYILFNFLTFVMFYAYLAVRGNTGIFSRMSPMGPLPVYLVVSIVLLLLIYANLCTTLFY